MVITTTHLPLHEDHKTSTEMSKVGGVCVPRRPRLRPRPIIFVPGITGKPRCLSKNKNLKKFDKRKKTMPPPCRQSHKLDFQHVLAGICREKKQADSECEIVSRLKRDLEEGIIREAADIQGRLEFHANCIANEPEVTLVSDQFKAVQVVDDTTQSSRLEEEEYNTDEISPGEHDHHVADTVSAPSHDALERCSPETTVTNSSEDSNMVDKSFHTKSTMSTTSESDSVSSDDYSLSSDEESYAEDLDGCYGIAPIPSSESAAMKLKPDWYLMERIASSDTEDTIDVYEDETTCSSVHLLSSHQERRRVEKPIQKPKPRRSPRYYSTSVAYLSTFGSI